MADIKFEEYSDEVLATLQQGAAAELDRRAPKAYLSDITPNMTPEKKELVLSAIKRALKGLGQ